MAHGKIAPPLSIHFATRGHMLCTKLSISDEDKTYLSHDGNIWQYQGVLSRYIPTLSYKHIAQQTK